MHIIIGLIIIVVGALIIVKSEWMLANFGRMGWFERHFGGGGSRMGYKLIGGAVFFIGLMVLTNMIGGFITWVFSPVIRHSQNLR